jgi:hypothetical protein
MYLRSRGKTRIKMPAIRETIGESEEKRSVKAPPLVCAKAVVVNKLNSIMETTPSLSFNPHLLL